MEVADSQRLLEPAEVLEQLCPLLPLAEPLELPIAQPRAEEALQLPRLPDCRDHAVAGPRQQPGRVQHPLQHRLEVETLVDTQTRLAQPGKTRPQRPDLSR